MPSQQINAFVERLEADEGLAAALELDAFGALRDRGFDQLATAVEQERDRIGKLVDRIYRDDEFRRAVEEDPIAGLTGWGIPDVAIAPVLVLAGAPDEVVERATADVEAHLLGRKQATIAATAAMLGALAFAQQSSAAAQPATAGAQLAPAAQAQVSPAAQAQVSPAATTQLSPADKAQVSAASRTQLSPAAKAQISKTARAGWHGLRPDRLAVQGQLGLLLHTHRPAR
jgi:hypothetical protein